MALSLSSVDLATGDFNTIFTEANPGSKLVRLKEFIESSLDMYRSEYCQLLLPIFVYLYLDLTAGGYVNEAQEFFSLHHKDQESFYSAEISRLKSITSSDHFHGNDLVESFNKNKFSIRMSNKPYQCLLKFLQGLQSGVLLSIINNHFNITVFDGDPRSASDIQARAGSLLGEPDLAVNKTKVLYGIPRDPDLAALMAQMEEEEEQEMGVDEDNKPKKKKAKKDLSGKKSKSGSTPHAPSLTRLPLPKPRDCELLAKFSAYKEQSKCNAVGIDNLPSICFYTILNASDRLTGVSISDDASLLSGSFSDSLINLWSLTPRRLLSLLDGKHLEKIPNSTEDVMQRILDPLSGSVVKSLVGHSGPVFSTAFSPDNTLLISASEDGTVRLWSLQVYTTLMVYKGHNYPVWSVDYSPLGYYFASASHDKTISLWNTEQAHPIRMLVGHATDVDIIKFHPNGNYIASGSSDKTVRLWDVLTGECVRILSGHKHPISVLAFSFDGKYLVSADSGGCILVWGIPSAKQLAEFKGHKDSVYALSFSRDNNLLASGGQDKCVKVWNFANISEEGTAVGRTHECLETFRTKDTKVFTLHFTRKNLLLASGSYL